MPNLFVIFHEQDEPVIYKTAATAELLQKLDKARGQMAEYTKYEDSADYALPLHNQTRMEEFRKAAGDVPLERVAVDEFLTTMGADGIDAFY